MNNCGKECPLLNISLIPLYGKIGLGKYAIVDIEDYELLNRYQWNLSRGGYVFRSSRKTEAQKRTSMYVHRIIMNSPQDLETDHKNNNKLDNRKCNLRICNGSQNKRNRLKEKTYNGKPTCSVYKGVTWHKGNNKWRARIVNNKQEILLGYFITEEQAALAYNSKARELFGTYLLENKI